jgi:hypothetical protein
MHSAGAKHAKALPAFDVENVNISERKNVSAPSSHRKKDRIERLKEKEREYERERDDNQRELQAHYRQSITAAAKQPTSSTRQLLMTSNQSAINALNYSVSSSVGNSKPSSPTDHASQDYQKPFVVRHLSAAEVAAATAAVNKSSPPTNTRLPPPSNSSGAASGSNGNSRHSSPSGISSHMYSSVGTSGNISSHTSMTNQAVAGVNTVAAGTRSSRTASSSATPQSVLAGTKRHTSPPSSRSATGSHIPVWHSSAGSSAGGGLNAQGDSAHLISHRTGTGERSSVDRADRGDRGTSLTRSSSRPKY